MLYPFTHGCTLSELDLAILPSEIPVLREGTVVLGSPVGYDDFCSSMVLRKTQQVISMVDNVSRLNDLHLEYRRTRSLLMLLGWCICGVLPHSHTFPRASGLRTVFQFCSV